MGENFFLKTGSHNWRLCFHSASANFKLSTVNRKTIQLIIPSGLSSYSTPHQFENLLFLSESHTLYPLVHWAMFSCLVYCDFVDPISPSAFIGVITWWTVGAAIGDLVRGGGSFTPIVDECPPRNTPLVLFSHFNILTQSLVIRISTRQLNPPGSCAESCSSSRRSG